MKLLQDKSIDPRQRLAWAPTFAPFAMSFKDFNRTILRKEPATSCSKLQTSSDKTANKAILKPHSADIKADLIIVGGRIRLPFLRAYASKVLD
jgi:hypothetical protein